MAPQAMNDMLIKNCEFINCGQTLAKCAFDAEDGWEMMQDSTFTSLNFHDNPNNVFLTCAGQNFIIDNLINGKITLNVRTNSTVIKNCLNIKIIILNYGALSASSYIRFYNNTIVTSLTLNNLAAGLAPVIKSSIIYGIINSFDIVIFKDYTIIGNSSSPTSLALGNYKNCIIKNKIAKGHRGGNYTNCSLENISGYAYGIFNFLIVK